MGRSCRTLPPYPGGAGSLYLDALSLPRPLTNEPGKTRGTRVGRTQPPRRRPYPLEGPGRTVGMRVCLPWGENCWSHTPLATRGRLYPPNGPGRAGGTQVPSVAWGGTGSPPVHGPPRGFPIPQRPRRTGGTGVCLPLCGAGLKVLSYMAPTGRPYPPGRTGGTRVCPPLCREVLDLHTPLAPPRGVPIP